MMLKVLSSKLSIPKGYRFLPTKEEVLYHYLRPAIHGAPLPCDVLMEGDIYGENKEPWKLFDEDSQHSFWIFTRLKRKSKSKIDRVAGCGCWLNRATKEVYDSQGTLIGFDKYFTFTFKKDKDSRDLSRANHGNWIMHEYSLSDEGLNDYVICEVRNKDADDQTRSSKKRKTPWDVDVSEGEASSKKVCGDDHEFSASVTHPSYHEHEQIYNHDQLSWNNPIQSLSSCCPQRNQEEETPAAADQDNEVYLDMDVLAADGRIEWKYRGDDESQTMVIGIGSCNEASTDLEALYPGPQGTPAAQLVEEEEEEDNSSNPDDYGDVNESGFLIASTKNECAFGLDPNDNDVVYLDRNVFTDELIDWEYPAPGDEFHNTMVTTGSCILQ